MTTPQAIARIREILTAAGYPGPMKLSGAELDEIARLRAYLPPKTRSIIHD